MDRTRIFVAFVVLGAIGTGVVVYLLDPVVTRDEIAAVAVLAGLAAMAEMVTFLLPRGTIGSLGFIPYTAAFLVVPSWPTVLAAAVVRFCAETSYGRRSPKREFNVAQIALTLGAALLMYRALGGTALLQETDGSLAQVTRTAGLPALAAFVFSFFVNALLVQGVIALATNITLRQAIRENVVSSIGVDLLASPIVFLFAWLYAQHGAIAALGVWVPIVGLRQLTKTNLELERTNQELLQLMVKSIEARDPYTSGHSRRVSYYAKLIARAVGMPLKEIERIEHAALLHDVGKIYEKYAPILAKPDKLTPEEWATMQQHPIDGAELISTMTRLRDLVPAVRHHHEKWDGSGYPDQLSGYAIPIGARIITLADTIDAMISERPYRRSMSASEVRAEIVRERGRQFDPELVDKLLAENTWQRIFSPVRDSDYGPLSVVGASSARRFSSARVRDRA